MNSQNEFEHQKEHALVAARERFKKDGIAMVAFNCNGRPYEFRYDPETDSLFETYASANLVIEAHQLLHAPVTTGEEEASKGLDICGYAGKWKRAKEVVGSHVAEDSADYWPNVRKHFLELGGEFKKPHGPGRVEVIEESPFETVRYFVNQLASMPNAFDPVTGKINQENDKAVLLHNLAKMAFAHTQGPIFRRA